MLEKPDVLFYKLEEKLVALLSERDGLIGDNQRLTMELQELKAEKEVHARKLHDLVLLVESVNDEPQTHVVAAESFSPSLAAIKPLMAQGQV